jgi:hypothetical protein
MKIFKACIIKLAILSISSSVFAIDLLNLDNYAEGASLPYGENLIVKMVETTGEKYIVGKSSGLGKLKFPVKLTGDFEVSFKVFNVLKYYNTWFNFFLTAGEHQLNVTFSGDGNTKLTADSQSGGGDASDAFIRGKSNTFRLAISNNIAKLYINDVFSQKVTLTPNLIYTQLIAIGIESQDAVYDLNINGNANIRPQPENANVDLLNLTDLDEGTSVPYGENLIVSTVKTTGEKYLNGVPDKSGKLKFPVSLTGNFEVLLTALEYYDSTEFNFFLTADEYKINFTFDRRGNTKLTTDSKSGGGDASNAFVREKPNTFLLAVNNNVANLYINDVFSQKVTLRPDLTYTQLVIFGIENADAFYSLSINGNVSSNPTETLEQTPEQTECTATYTPKTGRIVIPCISAPNEFGKTTLYSVQMQQQPNSFRFDLDFNTVQPR